MSFIDPASLIVTDQQTLKDQFVLPYLETNMPSGWQIVSGDLEDLMIDAMCQIAAQQADVIVQQILSQFRYLGGLVGAPPIAAAPATATATFTAIDTAGYTIPASETIVAIRDSNGDLQAFDLITDLVIPPASNTGSGLVVAEVAGANTNGLSGTAQLLQGPASIASVTLAAAAGGLDAEDDNVYLGRLAQTLGLLLHGFTLAPDAAILARNIPGVARAVAVDNLKPGPPYDGAAEATGQEKNLTVALTDINGASVGSTIRATVKTMLQALREQNFVVWTVDAQSTSIDVTAAVVCWPGQVTATVQAAVVAALNLYLNPASYGADPFGVWVNDPVIRLGTLMSRVQAVDGVRYISSLTFCLHSGTLGTANVTLGAGSAIPALPAAGTIVVTAT